MVPDIKREPDVKKELELNADEVENVTRLLDETQRRSRRIRAITVGLLLGLIACGSLLSINVYEQHQRAKERLAELQRAQEEARKADEQRAELEKRAEVARKVSSLLNSGATKARYEKHWKEALANYDEALALDPDNPEALGLAGYLRFRMGDTQPAEHLLHRAVEIDPTSAWSRYNLALVLWANGKKDDAVAQVEQVLKIDPSFKSIIAADHQFDGFKRDPKFKRMLGA